MIYKNQKLFETDSLVVKRIRTSEKLHIFLTRNFGVLKKFKCKTCRFLSYIKDDNGRKHYKCDMTALHHLKSEDWRLKWTACGKYKMKIND